MTEIEASQEESKEPVIEISFGKRAFGFHRDPEMPMHHGGFLTADWSIGEEPRITYYVPNPRSRGLHWLEVEHALTTWEKRKTDTPQIPGRKNAIIAKRTGYLNPENGEINYESKGPENLTVNLKVKAKPITIELPPPENP